MYTACDARAAELVAALGERILANLIQRTREIGKEIELLQSPCVQAVWTRHRTALTHQCQLRRAALLNGVRILDLSGSHHCCNLRPGIE